MVDSRITRRTALAGLAAVTAGAAGLAPVWRAGAQDEEPVPGGTLRRTISEDPDFLDPARTILLVSANLMMNMYDSLVYIAEDGSPQPWLAESWELANEGRTVTFTIRDGVMFTDGTPLDAPAIKANLDRHLDPAVTSPRLSNLGSLESVDAPDATTLVLHFTEPYAPLFAGLADTGIYSPTALETLGDEFGRAPVGSGPFILTEWEAGTRLRFERNPDYVNFRQDDLNSGPAYVDAIEYHIIPEAATQTAAFEAGEIDILTPSREDLTRITEDPAIQIFSFTNSNNLNFIEFGNYEPFSNPLLRKAISYAINREQVVEIAYFGNGTVHQCPVPIGNAAYDEALCGEYGTSYDPEAAKAALAEAGWTDEDGDGFVEIDGSTDPLTLYSYGPFPVQARAIELMQADLLAVGINTEIRILETAALLAGIQNDEVGMDYIRWTLTDQQILSRLFKSPGWAMQMDDPELDALIAVADSTIEPEARIEASQAVMQYVLEKFYIVPICSDWVQVAMRPNVRDYHWDALTYERLIDVWLVP